MSDADQEELNLDELEGGHVTLKRVGPTAQLAAKIAEHPDMRDMMGHVEEIDQARLEHLMDEEENLYVWEILQGGTLAGYCLFVLFDGPPFIGIYAFDAESFSIDAGKECMELLVPLFFKATEEGALYFYLPHPVDPEVQETLVENGFDVWDENPTINNDEVACFVLERYTFDAYFGEGSEEFEEFDEEAGY